MYAFTQPLQHKQDMTQSQFFKWNKACLNTEVSFSETNCITKDKKPQY